MPDFISNIPSPDAQKFIIDDLDYIMDNSRLYTASQTTAKNPYQSKARLPEIAMDRSIMNNKPQTSLKRPINNFGGNARTTLSEVAKARQAAHIDELLSSINLDLKDVPEMQKGSKPPAEFQGKIAGIANKLLGILSLATYSPDLNSLEKRQLFELRAYGTTLDQKK